MICIYDVIRMGTSMHKTYGCVRFLSWLIGSWRLISNTHFIKHRQQGMGHRSVIPALGRKRKRIRCFHSPLAKYQFQGYPGLLCVCVVVFFWGGGSKNNLNQTKTKTINNYIKVSILSHLRWYLNKWQILSLRLLFLIIITQYILCPKEPQLLSSIFVKYFLIYCYLQVHRTTEGKLEI